jgi:predicted ATPase
VSENCLNIRRLVLRRFRSVRGDSIELSNPLFLVGKNGSGKSNVVDAFSFLSECMSLPLHTVFQNRGGINAVRYRSGTRSRPGDFAMRVEFDFPNGATVAGWYAFDIRALPDYTFLVQREKCSVVMGGAHFWFDRQADNFHTNVTGLKPALGAEALALPIIGGSKEFASVVKGLGAMRVFSIQPAKIGELQEPDAGTNLKSDGSNLASVLQLLSREDKKSLESLCEILGTIVPDTTKVRTVKHGKRLSLEFTQEWESEGETKSVKFEAFSMSDGTLRALGILSAFFQKSIPTLIAIEEPESTIHPEALESILDVIRSFARRTQIVVTTHSPELLDAKWIRPENLRIVTWKEGVTRVCSLGKGSVKALQGHLMGAGEQLRANALRADEVDVFADNDDQQLQLFEELPA